jgi:phosphoserine phosphatase
LGAGRCEFKSHHPDHRNPPPRGDARTASARAPPLVYARPSNVSDIILLNVSGFDRPGITHRLTSALAAHGVRILDIGQAVIHQTVSIGLLFQLPESAQSAPVVKDVLFAAHELGLEVRFAPISVEEYEEWVRAQGKPRYIITIFGPYLSAEHMSRLSAVLKAHQLNIAQMWRLSGRDSLKGIGRTARTCVELSVRGAPDAHELRKELLTLAQDLGVDIAIQKDDVYRRNRRLVAFDMDSTLIQAEVIDELARVAGVGDAVSRITEAAMRGELDFKQSLAERLSLLKGMPATVLAEVAERLPLTDGAQLLISTLKNLGYKTAIISGGFSYFGKYLQQKLGVDYVFANELEIEDGKLTGRVIGPIVDGPRKAALLREIAHQEGIRLEQVIAVGDGANDLPMLDTAGLGIAFHAKPKVKASAEQSINILGLDGILYLIGLRDRDVLGVYEDVTG